MGRFQLSNSPPTVLANSRLSGCRLCCWGLVSGLFAECPRRPLAPNSGLLFGLAHLPAQFVYARREDVGPARRARKPLARFLERRLKRSRASGAREPHPSLAGRAGHGVCQGLTAHTFIPFPVSIAPACSCSSPPPDARSARRRRRSRHRSAALAIGLGLSAKAWRTHREPTRRPWPPVRRPIDAALRRTDVPFPGRPPTLPPTGSGPTGGRTKPRSETPRRSCCDRPADVCTSRRTGDAPLGRWQD
jgi:hypothetical protein